MFGEECNYYGANQVILVNVSREFDVHLAGTLSEQRQVRSAIGHKTHGLAESRHLNKSGAKTDVTATSLLHPAGYNRRLEEEQDRDVSYDSQDRDRAPEVLLDPFL